MLNLAFDNKANFARSDRRGTMTLLNGGRATKASPMGKIIPAKGVDAPKVNYFWADRHSPDSTASGTTSGSRTAAVRKIEAFRPGENDFWGQRHSV